MESKENKSPKKFSPELLHLEYSKDKIFRNTSNSTGKTSAG